MNRHDQIDYVEFPSKDLEATKDFFKTVFAWSFEDYGEEYTAFTDLRMQGGFFKSELAASTSSGSALIVIYSDNLEDSMKRVEAAGGKIVQPIFAFPGGRRFHFTEPCGNEFAIWSEI